MKKLVSLAITAALALSLAACGYSQEELDYAAEHGYKSGYQDGFEKGKGSSDGSSRYSSDVDDLINDAIWEAELEAAQEGFHPDEALGVLEDYLNGYGSKADAWAALDSLTVYYYESLRFADYVEKFGK